MVRHIRVSARSRQSAGDPPWADIFLDRDLTDFLFALAAESGLARRSVCAARYGLRSYIRWLQAEDTDWRDASPDVILAYLRSTAEMLAYPTLILRQWVLHRLYAWSAQQGLTAIAPEACLLRLRQQPYPAPYVPSPQAVERLLRQPDDSTAMGQRDRAILELLYATGLRGSELVGLSLHQIEYDHRTIQVVGKGGFERIVVFGLAARDCLDRYVRSARSAILGAGNFGAGCTDRLFVHPGRAPGMRYGQLRLMFRCHADAAGLPMATPHTLRHAFATHLYQFGANLRVIQQLLGHQNLQTTTIYVTAATQAMREIIERHHPRGTDYEPVPPTGSPHRRGWAHDDAQNRARTQSRKAG